MRPLWLTGKLHHAVITSAEGNDLADFTDAAARFLLPLAKRFVGGLHGAFGVLAAFDNTGVAQVGLHITGQNKGIGAHLAQRVRTRVTT